jgi:soluble lytic murein transglycosylase
LRERCDRLSDALLNEAALVACDAALAVVPGDRELLRERAMLLFRMRRYPEAVVGFEALGPNDRSARFWRARSLARSGRIEASIEAFDRLAAVAEPELAARARFLAGTLHEDDDLAKADASYRRVAESAPLATQRSDAQWRLAWLAWRAGDWARARTAFTRYLTDEREPEGLQRGRYWRARTLSREGNAAGEQELAELAREAPFTYYGWRAASRESENEDAPSVAAPEDAEVASAREDAEVASAPPSLAPSAALPPALLRRLEILLAAGLDERAAREVRPLAGRAASLSTRLALGQLLLEAGQFQRAQRLVLDAHRAELTGAPTPGREALWWLAWPTAFDQSVEPAAAANGIPAALVYAIMREESGYQPGALSVVGARGLTQIMPETGRRLASDLGAARFDPDELFVPERNLELGAFYLSRLVDRFDGRLSAAIASYNAGPEAVARWLASGAELEDDEWVEAIPYEQTRGYVKRVLRSLHAYRMLYDT